jgi:hypothetical protein
MASNAKMPSLHELVYEIFDELTSVVVAKGFWKKLSAVSGEPTLLASISAKLGSVVLDVLVVQETEAAEVGNAKRHTFLTDLMKAGLKEYLVKNVDIVWRFSISSAAVILGIPEPNLSRVHRVATSKHFFTLPNHNLLREESEGYSKLISVLLTTDFEQQPTSLTHTLTQLIGAYALHPTRVLDLVLSASGYHLDRFFDAAHSQPSFSDYVRTLAPIRAYLETQDRSHIYTLLAFHVRPHSWSKDGSAPAKPVAATPATTSAPIEPIENLAVSTCRILAMLVRFGLLKLHETWSLLNLPIDASSADTHGKDTENAEEPQKEGERIFATSAKIQMLATLLEIPSDEPLAFVRDDTPEHELFMDVLQSNFFRSKRVARVFSTRVVSHLQPLLSSLMASHQLNLASKGSEAMPTLQVLIDVLFDLKDLLCMMSETISAPLHHLLCLLCGSIVDGVIHSGVIASELEQQRGQSHTSGTSQGFGASFKKGSSTEGSRIALPREIENVALETMASAFGAVEDVMTQVILPSFVCLEINADNMWKLLQKFPFEWRNRVYHSWGKMMRNSAYPGLTEVGTDCRLKVRGMMKRMTDSSIKETGRPLCKYGNKFPPVLSDLVSSLVFPNFVQPLAESMRYLSDLSLDVLIYACLDAALNMPPSASAHFASVAAFIASVYKLHYERLDIVPLLEVIEQLVKRSKLTGATLFTTLLSKMGCVDILEETASSQVRMVNSFPSLNTLGISGALQSKETSRSSIIPLRDRLWSSNSWLPLYILVLQLEQQCAFHTESNDLTVISHSIDSVHQLSLQLAEFTSFIFKEYAHQVNPSVLLSAGQIAIEYRVPYPSLLHLYRPILHLIYSDVAHLIGTSNPSLVMAPTNQATLEVPASLPKGSSKTTNSRGKTPASSSLKPTAATPSQNRSLLLSEDLEQFTRGVGRTVIPFPIEEKLQSILDSLMPPPDPNAEYYIEKTDLTPIKDIFPMSPHFMAAFWGLRLIDVECNESLYRQSISQQSQAQQSTTSSSQTRRDKSLDISPATLEKDLNAHADHVKAVFERLKSDLASKEWFDASMGYRSTADQSASSHSMDVDSDSNSISEFFASLDDEVKKRCISLAFLQHCIIPRAMMSADDALYCAAFIRTLHRLNPSPLWDTDVFIDVFLSIVPLLFSSTSTNESGRFGRLVCSVFEQLVAWRDFDTWQADLGGRDYSSFTHRQASSELSTNPEAAASNSGMEVDSPLSLSKSTHANDTSMVASGDHTGDMEISSERGPVRSETPVSSTSNSGAQLSSSGQPSEVDMDVSGTSSEKPGSAAISNSSNSKPETESPWRLAHRDYCLKSIKWEKTLLDHVMEGITKPVDRWMRRAILFFLKEMSAVFPTSERFCALLSHCLKQNATGTGSDDLKALVNSYQNLLELKAKTSLPHAQFQLLFPGFEFPSDPTPIVERNADTATTAASETKAAPSAYSTSTVNENELSEYRQRDYGHRYGRNRFGNGPRTTTGASSGNSASVASGAPGAASTTSNAASSSHNTNAKQGEDEKSGRTARGRGTTSNAPRAPTAPTSGSSSTPNPSNNASTGTAALSSNTGSTQSGSSNAGATATPSTSNTASASHSAINTSTSSNAPKVSSATPASREHGGDRSGSRDSRSVADRDAARDHRDHRDGRDGRDVRDNRDTREFERGGPGNHRDFPRDYRDQNSGPRDFRDREYGGGMRDGRDQQRDQNRDFGRGPSAGSDRFDRDRDSRDTREGRDSREVRDREPPRDSRGGNDFRDAPRDRDARDQRDARDSRPAGQVATSSSSNNPHNPKKRGRNGEADLPAPEAEKRPKTAENNPKPSSSRSDTPANGNANQPKEREATIGPPLPPSSRSKRR